MIFLFPFLLTKNFLNSCDSVSLKNLPTLTPFSPSQLPELIHALVFSGVIAVSPKWSHYLSSCFCSMHIPFTPFSVLSLKCEFYPFLNKIIDSSPQPSDRIHLHLAPVYVSNLIFGRALHHTHQIFSQTKLDNLAPHVHTVQFKFPQNRYFLSTCSELSHFLCSMKLSLNFSSK